MGQQTVIAAALSCLAIAAVAGLIRLYARLAPMRERAERMRQESARIARQAKYNRRRKVAP
jgi:hypothetical protein